MNLALVWLGLMILFCIVEGATVGLVSIWFAIGSLAALIAALAGGNLILQVVVFAIVSILAIALIRPLAGKVFAVRHEPTNADRIIGQEAVVLVPISQVEGTGQVKVDGKVWTAKAPGGEDIPEGETVTVLGIEGAKVTVAPLKTKQPTDL